MNVCVKIIFERYEIADLEKKVNEFLLKTGCVLIREHYQSLITEDGWGNSVLLVYRMPENQIKEISDIDDKKKKPKLYKN